MDFVSIRDFRTSPRNIWERLSRDGEAVVTNNGKPIALLLNIEDGAFDDLSRAVRQAKAMMSINRMRGIAAENGYMADDEIETEIQAARADRRARNS
jgi:hypothetical protein